MGPSEIGYYTVKDGKRSHKYQGWNPLVGCTNQCPTCWARRMAKRLLKCPKCREFTTHFHWERMDDPSKRKKPALILANFQSDWIGGFDDEIGRIIQGVVWDAMREATHHTFITLTQHPKALRKMLARQEPADHIYHGVTITTQEQADERLRIFKGIPGNLWLSMEPLKERVDLRSTIGGCEDDRELDRGDSLRCERCGEAWDGIDHECAEGFQNGIRGIIVGQDSVKGAPGTDTLDHIRSVVEQCQAAQVNVFVKQIWVRERYM